MRTNKVVVTPYDSKWKDDFELIKEELESVFSHLVISIEHVGSTSVEGMYAKPIIDIDVVIKDYSIFDDVASQLESIGYIHEGNLGIERRETFKYTDKSHLQTHHLYVCPKDSKELHRHLRFRDFLRSNHEARLKYSQTKIEAAMLYPDDIDAYINHKSSCIEELYKLCGLKL